jgi:hypothetical protein
MSRQWCFGCEDGGKLIDCDSCPRAVCTKCIPQLADVGNGAGDIFKCPVCHLRDPRALRQPYMVGKLRLSSHFS